MAERKIITRIQISGEAEYRKALSTLSASLSVYKTELSALKNQYKDSQNGIEYLTKKSAALNTVQQTQAEKIRVLSDALNNAKKAQEEYNQKVTDAKAKVDAAKKTVDDLKEAVGENSDEYKKAKDNLDSFNQELDEAQQEQQLCADAVNRWQSKLNTAELQQKKTNDEIKKNNQYLKEAKSSTDGCATSIDQYGKKVKTAAEKTESASKELMELGNAMAASGIKQAAEEIAQMLGTCIEKAEEFQTSIAKLQTIAGSDSIDSLSSDILDLSNATGIAASDLANTAYNAISAGTAVADSVDMAEQASKLAIAGFTDTDSALSVLTTTINAYGESAGTAAEISDSLIVVQNLGVTTVAELAANMGKAIATASAYGVNLANLESAYISTTKAGINAAESTTYLSSMFKELGDDGTEVSKVLTEKTGMSFGQAMKSGMSLADILQILSDSVDGDSEALMNLWSSAEAGKGANAILSQGISTFNKNLETVQKSAGITESAYQTMADTGEMAGQRLSNAVTNLQVAIGEELEPTLTSIKSKGADIVEAAAEFVKDNPRIVAAVSALAVGIGIMAGGFAAATLAVTALNKMLTIMEAHPIVATISAVVALTAALISLALSAEEAPGALTDYTQATEAAKDATQSLKDTMSETESVFQTSANAAKATKEQAEGLVEQLYSLANGNKVSNENMDQAAALVEQLNALYPELGLSLDQTTGELSKTNEEMERFITNASNDAMAEALEQKVSEQTQALVDAQAAMIDAENKATTADKEYQEVLAGRDAALTKAEEKTDAMNAAFDKYNAVLNDSTATVNEITEAENAYTIAQGEAAAANEELNAYLEEHNYELSAAEGAQKDCNEAIEEGNTTLEEAQEAVDEATQQLEDYQFRLTDVGEASQGVFDATNELLDTMDRSSEEYAQIKENLKEVTEAHVEYQDSMTAMKESIEADMSAVQAKYDEAKESILSSLESQVGGLDNVALEVDETTGKLVLGAEQIAANLQSQLDYLNQYAANCATVLNTTGLTMTETFTAFLQSGSEDAVQVAAAMNEAIQSGNLTAAQAVIDNYSAVQGTLDSTSSSLADASTNYSSTMEKLEGKMQDCVDNMNKEDAAYQNTLKTMQGAIRGVTGQTSAYIGQYKTAANHAAAAMNVSGSMYTAGINNVRGAINGVDALSGTYVQRYRNMAAQAQAALKSVDAQASPSKKYKQFAKYNVEGAIIGVDEAKDDYIKAYGDMAKAAFDEYENQISALQGGAGSAAESYLGAVVGNGLNQKESSSALEKVGSAISGANSKIESKLSNVLALLSQYLPKSGDVYLSGEKVGKVVTPTVSNQIDKNTRLMSKISGVNA